MLLCLRSCPACPRFQEWIMALRGLSLSSFESSKTLITSMRLFSENMANFFMQLNDAIANQVAEHRVSCRSCNGGLVDIILKEDFEWMTSANYCVECKSFLWAQNYYAVVKFVWINAVETAVTWSFERTAIRCFVLTAGDLFIVNHVPELTVTNAGYQFSAQFVIAWPVQLAQTRKSTSVMSVTSFSAVDAAKQKNVILVVMPIAAIVILSLNVRNVTIYHAQSVITYGRTVTKDAFVILLICIEALLFIDCLPSLRRSAHNGIELYLCV